LAEHQRQLEAEKAAGGALAACQQKRRWGRRLPL